MSRKALAVFIFLSILVAMAPGFAAAVTTATIDPLLKDTNYLKKEGYLGADNRVNIIIQMKVPYNKKITSQYTSAKDSVVTVLKSTLKYYKVGHDLQIIGSFSARVDISTLNSIAANTNVKHIDLDNMVQGKLGTTVPLIDANDAWSVQTSGGSYINGNGIKVAILDTGINCNHVNLQGKVINFTDFTGSALNGSGSCWKDGHGHGTQVAGIIGANGSLEGVAPQVRFNIYKVLDNNANGTESNVVAGFQQAINDGNKIASMSLGFNCLNSCNYLTNSLYLAVENSNDILAVVAAGNEGNTGDGSISIPGVSSKALTVGATFKTSLSSFVWNPAGAQFDCSQSNVNENNIACFSSKGPTSLGVNKPDIVAPGVRIDTTDNCISCYTGSNSDITSGTSFATPHVTGVAALVLQKHPTWSPSQIKERIKKSAVYLPGYDINTQGSGRVNALYALDELAPNGSININSGASYTNVTSASLSWLCTDGGNIQNPNTGTRNIYFSNDGSTWTEVNTTASSGTHSWTLSSGDGTKTVHFKCTDKGGNVASVVNDTIILDTTNPTASDNYGPNNTWTTQTQSATINYSDATSGVASVQYCWGSSCDNFETLTSNPYTFGDNYYNDIFRYKVTDNAGLSIIKAFTVMIDKIIPITTNSFSGGTPGNNGWYISGRTATLSCSDGQSSGCQETKYQVIEEGTTNNNFNTYSSPFTVSEDGRWDINFFSNDVAGNTEPTRNDKLYIDKTDPTTNYSQNPASPNSNGWYAVESVQVTLSCTDLTSGCNKIVYNLNGDIENVPGSGPVQVTIPAGESNLTFYSTDNAGNEEVPTYKHFNVDPTLPRVTITSPNGSGVYTGSDRLLATGNLVLIIKDPVTVGSYSVKADVNASQYSGLKHVELFVNDGKVTANAGQMSCTSSNNIDYTCQYNWNPNTGVTQEYTLIVKATSNAGNWNDRSVKITLSANV